MKIPETGDEITLRDGRFGTYVQQGEGEKPKRSSLPKTLNPSDVTLEQALALLSLPREVAVHPETKAPIVAGIGRYGPYVQHGKTYANIGKDEDILSIGGNRAIDLIVAKESGLSGRRFGAQASSASRELGDHPQGGAVVIKAGRFGPYVNWGKINATLPRDSDPTTVTLEDAIALLAAKAQGGGGGGTQGRVLGQHPSGGDIVLREGRFGPYVSLGKINATLKNGVGADSITLEDAIQLIDAKGGVPAKKKTASKAKPAKATAKARAQKSSGEENRDQSARTEGEESVIKKAGSAKAGPPGAKPERPKGALPSKAEILAFIGREQPNSPTKIGKREIARAFSITGADRIGLKKILRELEAEGAVARNRKQLHKAGQLPAVVLADIASRDADGELIAQPVEWDTEQGPVPKILIYVGKRRPGQPVPGVGDRELVRVEPAREAGPNDPAYNGRVIKLFDRAKTQVLGIYRADPSGGARVVPIDKRNARVGEFVVAPDGDGGAQEGDLVAVDVLRTGRLGLAPVRVREKLGSLASEKAMSLIAHPFA